MITRYVSPSLPCCCIEEELAAAELKPGSGSELETMMLLPVALPPMSVNHMTLGIADGLVVQA